MRLSGGTGQPTKFSRRKPGRSKSHKKATAAPRGRRSSVTELQEQLNALTRELSVGREQQTATANVLKIIGGSTYDLQTVLDTLTESAARLCEADMAAISRQDATGFFHQVTNYNFPPDWVEYNKTVHLQPGRGSVVGRVLLESRPVQAADVFADPEYAYLEVARKGGWRTFLGVPLLRDRNPIGVISLARRAVAPFTDRQIELVSTFADQAVIAIENARLFEEVQARTRELTESLQQQTATADVLKVISQSTFQLQPIFDTIVQTAGHLCNAEAAFIFMFREEKLHLVATNNASDAFINYITEHPLLPERGSLAGRTFVERKGVHIPDCLADPEYKVLNYQTIGKYRSMLGVPLLREGVPIGVISLLRMAVMPFTERQIDLVKTFADQAVIAIENVRLFEGEQQRTRELTVSLQQQTATAEVLKVIMQSTFRLQAVFDTIVQTASRLCGAEFALIFMFRDDALHLVASNNASDVFVQHAVDHPITPGRGSLAGRTFVERQIVHVPDCLADPEYTLLDYQAVGEYRSMLGVPLLREGAPLGVICLLRAVVVPFTDKQIDLVKTLADQAVIAIENVRLFEAEQQRTRELTESLQQQTATADVLKVISQSTFDLQTVLDTLVESATRLCSADHAWLFQRDGEIFRKRLPATEPRSASRSCARVMS